MTANKRLAIFFSILAPTILALAAYIFFFLDKPTKPNIIWISLDTQRAQSLNIYGYKVLNSPFLSSFGHSNIIFDKTYAQSTITHTSHFSMLSGTYPIKHGVLSIDPDYRLNPKIKMAAEILKDQGYQTLISGSINRNPYLNLEVGIGRGFDRININDPILFPFSTELTLKHIQEMVMQKKPFFAFIHTASVHAPYFPPPSFFAPYDFGYKGKILWSKTLFSNRYPNETPENTFAAITKDFISRIDVSNPQDLKMVEALYNAVISYQDDNLRKFFTQLEKIIPDFDKTIIIITADHGESMGEHGDLQHGNMTQENIWIPLLIHLPNQVAKRVSTPVRSIDILPTVLDFLNVEIPENIDGQSLLPLIHGKTNYKKIATIFTHKNEKYAVFKDDWKFISRKGNEELYNLKDDPLEMKNVASIFSEVCFNLRNELQGYQLKTSLSPL